MEQTRPGRTLTAQEILNVLAHQRDRLRRMGVRRLGLFGSYRRGTPTADSDLDFLVVFDHVSFDRYMDLKFFLEDLFQRKVDLVLEHTIKPRLRPYILAEVQDVPGLQTVSGGHP